MKAKASRYREPKWTIHDERESEKLELEVFAIEMENRLDQSMQKIIARLKKERVKIQARLEKLKAAEGAIDPVKLSEKAYDEALTDSQIDQMHVEIEAMFADEELIAFHEVRIMYAMKHLEINTKMLLKKAFPEAAVKGLFKWEALADFLKARSIDIKTVEAYKEVDQLRQVNNFIKHAVGPDGSIQHIAEFKGTVSPSSDALEQFYQRIQKAPEVFVNSLLQAIYDHLYTFDTKRINAMVEELALRMDAKAARKFMRGLERYYR